MSSLSMIEAPAGAGQLVHRELTARMPQVPGAVLQVLFDTMHIGLSIVDDRGIVVSHNAAWGNLLKSGLPDTLALAASADIIDECKSCSRDSFFQPQAVAAGVEAVLSHRRSEFRVEYSEPPGTAGRTFELRGFAFPQGVRQWVLLCHEEITARKEAESHAVQTAEQLQELNLELESLNSRLARLATIDGLTGLANRGAFDRALEREWGASVEAAYPLGLVLFDVDYFKQFNDCCGHPAGDGCLREMAKALITAVSGTDRIAARYGGEEFAVILPGCDLAETAHFAEGFQKAVERLRLPHPGSRVASHVTVSGGCGASLVGGDSPAALLRRTDEALYYAKYSGRNKVAVQLSQGVV